MSRLITVMAGAAAGWATLAAGAYLLMAIIVRAAESLDGTDLPSATVHPIRQENPHG